MEGKAMSKFKPGDRVCRNDKPEETYLVAPFGRIVEAAKNDTPELDKKQNSLAVVTEELRIYWLEKDGLNWVVKEDTSEERDIDAHKAKEFERIMRKREFDKRVKELKKPSGVAETYWDGEHLANAIEKTVSTAMTPQAMWKL